jgi:lysophospholipase L1-like esterase
VSKGNRIRSALRRIGASGIAVIIMAPVTIVFVAWAVHPTPPPTGLVTLPTATPTASVSAQPSPPPPASTTPARPPVVAFLGDSYAAGAGASRPSTRWTDLVSRHLGWVEKNLSLTTASYCTVGEPGETSYRARIPALVATRAQIVVVSGGRADVTVGAARLRSDVRATLAGIHAGLPTAKIIVVSPTWGNSPAPAKLTALITIVRAEAVRAGATYLDIGEPLAGKVALMAVDGWQPNDAGHAAIAAAVEKALG